MIRPITILTAFFLLLPLRAARAEGDWSGARDREGRFKSEYESLRRLTPEETRRVVTSICEADEDERASVASDVHDRVASLIARKFEELERIKDEALRRLDDVIADDKLKDRRDEARSLREDVQRRWETIDKMTRSIRGKNHPVVRYTIEEGMRAHRDRCGSSSYCDVYEYSLPSGRADCLQASSCLVIELKPDNEKSIRRGDTQARGYVAELNNNPEIRKKLIERKPDFARCQTFRARVDCYRLCPDIDPDTNEMRSTYASWRTDCR